MLILIPLLTTSAKYLARDYPIIEITWARYAGQMLLHPDFASNGFVYLYWTESAQGVSSVGAGALARDEDHETRRLFQLTEAGHEL